MSGEVGESCAVPRVRVHSDRRRSDRSALIAKIAKSYVGTPFRHQGRLPGVGLDCVGVPICAMREIGIEVDEPDHYSMDPDSSVLIGCIREVADEIPASDIEPGDMLVFWWSKPDMPKHVAIYVGRGMMVHSYRSYRKTAMDHVDAMRKNIHSAWRLR